MRSIEDFNAIPSLRFRTVFWIVTTIWNRGDITQYINRCISNVYEADIIWLEIKMHVTEIVESIEGIPKELVEYMVALITSIYLRIRTMRTFYNFTPKFKNVYLDPVIYWTHYGTVDTKRHEELLVQDERNDIELRYSMACHDCFEDILQKLYDLLSDRQRERFLELNRNRELVSYWTHRLSDNLSTFSNLILRYGIYRQGYRYTAHQFAFLFTLLHGSKLGIKYFLNFLSPNEYELVLNNHVSVLTLGPMESSICPYNLNTRPTTHYNDAVYFLLSKLNENERMQVLRANSFTFLRNFLRYPFSGLFYKYTNILMDSLTWEQVSELLSEICIIEKMKDLHGYELFEDLWRKCPKVYKANIKDKYKNSSLHIESEYLLKRIKKIEQN